MMHYYFLYSDGDDKAEIYVSSSRNDVNMADKFLKIFNILSSRFPSASKSWVVNKVNKIVYKK